MHILEKYIFSLKFCLKIKKKYYLSIEAPISKFSLI